jgi:hypothetical protein
LGIIQGSPTDEWTNKCSTHNGIYTMEYNSAIKGILQVWWYIPVFPALRLRQENHEFKVSLSYITRQVSKQKDTNTRYNINTP